jgi:hypothetical protein
MMVLRNDRDDVSERKLFEVLNSCQKLTPTQESKYKAMYDMAKEVRMGRIVELGTHVGLAKSGMHVYVSTIDWFQPCVGVDGEKYAKADEGRLRNNLENANVVVTTYISTFKKVASDWAYPVGLLVWDGNVYRPDDDIADWERFILPGGRIAFYAGGDDLLGTHYLAEKYVDSGWYEWLPARPNIPFEIIKRRGNGVDK